MWRCRGCGADVFTAFSERGRKMIIEAEPSDNGNLVLRTEQSRWNDSSYLVASVVPPKGQQTTLFGEDDSTRYVDHHYRCPNAESFRGKL